MKNYIILTVVLTLTACSGSRGGRSAAPDAEIWTVASEMVNCSGAGQQRCLLIKPDGESDWQLFYSPIEGFDYVPGYEYVISVLKQKRDNPLPMDVSSYRYIFGKVISKERKQSENIPDTNHMFQ